MAKGKHTPRKPSGAEIFFLVLSVLLVLSMILSAFVKF